MNMHGFIKIAAAVPKMMVADPNHNAKEMLSQIQQAEKNGADIILFPELSLTAYTCADLFLNNTLIRGAENALGWLAEKTKKYTMAIIIGLPVSDGLHLYNCGLLLQKGKIRGVVPKSFLPDYAEFCEPRWFSPLAAATGKEITLCGQTVPFGQMVFTSQGVRLGIEICEDLWASVPPSAVLAQAGADVILNPAASNAVVGKRKYRKMLVESRSFTSHCGYVLTSAGPLESTTDTVYAGHVLSAENGVVLTDEQEMSFESKLYYTEIDIERIRAERLRLNTVTNNNALPQLPVVAIDPFAEKSFTLSRKIDTQPFVPSSGTERKERLKEVIDILTTALARRLAHTGAKTAVIGISGGLDSTLALLIAARAMDMLNRPHTDILAVTMPGFGTTGRTHKNAQKLMTLLGTTCQEINIKNACLKHFTDIGHDPKITDVTYENTQARERTQILMDLANKTGGLVIGTGDLSELALGWATYAGDHISMYGINAGVPKTLIRHLVDWLGQTAENKEIYAVLKDVLTTPVSPELLPTDSEGKIAQKTEEIIGDYMLHDFFLYYFIRFGFSAEKILYLAQHAFGKTYNKKTLQTALETFIGRFFRNQFKRSCLPDGPKIGSVSLSPRSDLKMPSDASSNLWLN